MPCFGVAEHRLGRGKPGDGHPVRRAGNIVQAERMAELDRFRIATMFATDPKLDVRARPATALNGHFYQRAHTVLVNRHERVFRQHAPGIVITEKCPRIIAGKTEACLRQIVGAK